MLNDLIITEVLTAATMYNGVGAHNHQTCRPSWGLAYRFEGQTIYRNGGKTLLSDAAHVAILPQGSAYEWECQQPGHYFLLQFHAISASPERHIFSLPVTNSDALLRRLRAMENARTLRRPHFQMENRRDTYTILLSLLETAYLPSPRQEKLAGITEYMAAHTDRSVTNAELAALAGLSEVYFRKLFTARYGQSPIAYHQSLRMRKACDMLDADTDSVTDIARALGYCDIYDFSRAFKNHTGISPLGYKKQSERHAR